MHLNEQKKIYRPCAGSTCDSSGKYLLKILYLDKHGWFCELCKEDLLKNGLVVEEYDLKNDPVIT